MLLILYSEVTSKPKIGLTKNYTLFQSIQSEDDIKVPTSPALKHAWKYSFVSLDNAHRSRPIHFHPLVQFFDSRSITFVTVSDITYTLGS